MPNIMPTPVPNQPAAKPETQPIADVQASADGRNIAIDNVGIKNIRYPLTVEDRSGTQNTVASVSMYVELPARYKGTHMSRFVDVLHTHQGTISVASFNRLLTQLSARLGAPKGRIELTFPYFVSKTAPVSGAQSMLDYEVSLSGEIDHDKRSSAVKVVVPVTSLCPCSKEISEYGAHNQRSHITIEVGAIEAGGSESGTIESGSNQPIPIEELIDLAESRASSELYGLLKRTDEKFITEKAYDNPKFVEDVVRDIAAALNDDERIARYSVSVENFESIHNHSAYAQISRDKTAR